MKRALTFLCLLFASLIITISLSEGILTPLNPSVAETHKIPSESTQRQAPLFDNLGDYHHPISTKNPLTQRYFDQGLILAYGFNHAEAARSFREAARLDANCAICYWGVAYALGPNINAKMEQEAVPEAWAAIEKARELSINANEVEKAYIQALAKRYPMKPVDDRKPFDLAYANAMQEVAQRYPDDLDAATLFAEALMDTTPWDYWQENGDPKPEGIEIMKTLEFVLERNPNHPGANHLYIHAVEKERPELGIASADRLLNLVPGAGHLVHMPSHIYIRVGRYQDAVVANQKAIAADNAYVLTCRTQGFYPLAYIPHNQHFLWFGALMSGQSQLAIKASHHTAQVDSQLMRQPDLAGALQHFYTIPLYTLTRFGKWDEILAIPTPEDDLKYHTGVWHYARGLALLEKGQLPEAAKELAALQVLSADPSLETIKIGGFNSTASILKIADAILSGQLAAKEGNYEQAIAHLKTAVKLEDALIYTEPAEWYQPTRQALGSVLLFAGRPAEAEQIYREDLTIYPENGWSLYGLSQSLKTQGKIQESKAIRDRWQEAWKYADVKPSAT